MYMAYLNGEFTPLSETKISPLDRGFLFGDGVYEVIPVYDGIMFGAKEHITRLINSMKFIHIDSPYTEQEWFELFEKLIAFTPNHHQSLYVQISRGADVLRHHKISKLTPTVFAFTYAWAPKSLAELTQGFNMCSKEDIRWHRCNIKSINLLGNILSLTAANEEGFDEVVFIRNGYVTEGSTGNIFIVKDNVIMGHPANNFILPGVTREVVLDLAKKHNFTYYDKLFNIEALYAADEVWLTGSNKEIVPVLSVDDRAIKDGKPGPIWHKMIDLYRQEVKLCQERKQTKEQYV